MPDREHPHGLLFLFDFINDPVHMRLLAVKQMQKLPLELSGLRGSRAAIGMRCERKYPSSSPLYQRAAA
jgi:hypothetical protein